MARNNRFLLYCQRPKICSELSVFLASGIGRGRAGLPVVPKMGPGASEIAVPGSLPRVVRLLAHVETDLPRSDVRHAFLGAAAALRDDLKQ